MNSTEISFNGQNKPKKNDAKMLAFIHFAVKVKWLLFFQHKDQNKKIKRELLSNYDEYNCIN